MKFVAIVLAASMLAAPVQAEWFDKGKAAFSNPGGKWRKAAINIEEGKIEVYSRGDRGLVAEFNEATVEHQTWVRRRGREGLAVAVGGFASLGLGYALAKGDEGTVVIRDDGVYVKQISAKRVGIVAAVVAGLAVAIGMTKAKGPYVEVHNGMKSINLRVSKDDFARFENSLKTFSGQE